MDSTRYDCVWKAGDVMAEGKVNDSIIVFIGAGNMAEALVRGILDARLSRPSHIRVTDVDQQRLKHFESSYQVTGFEHNAEAVKTADVVVLSIKPDVLPGVLKEVKGYLRRDALVISIAAGIKTRVLETMLGEETRVIRVMPNMPALVGTGAAAFCRGKLATEDDASLVKILFQSVGIIIRVEESALDAVTALSGSGPAYIFYLAEAMLKAAQEMGLDKSTARALTVATVNGAARLLTETGLEPAELRQRVTSKGGTTAAAIDMMEKFHIRDNLIAAIKAARNQSQKLSKQFDV